MCTTITLYKAISAAVKPTNATVLNSLHCFLCSSRLPASHSTSQLSQKLKTTYKASTSKVPAILAYFIELIRFVICVII